LSCRNSFFAKDIGYKHIKWLSKLHTVNPRISVWALISNLGEDEGALNQGAGGANSRIYSIIIELETLWNFVHVGFLKLRMSTSEIHLNSLHLSKRNSEPTALQWKTEIQL